MLQFDCPACNAKMQAPEQQAGQQAICPVCSAPVIIPGHSATGIAKPEHAEQVKVRPSAKDDGSFREGEPTIPHEPPPEKPARGNHLFWVIWIIVTLMAMCCFLGTVCSR
jgi:hypothetical protein